ncbi:MAG: helix-turn-helix domain-containing protein [Defluviitaleaceae bacterium]|nr:helix-turn-helix domain-containing protein [Defluviitaleaceae bacterium]
MDELQTLGSFITQKRTERDKTLRGVAREIGISPVYLCNIEKGRRPMNQEETLEKIANVLILGKEDRALLFDLAAKSKSILVAADLPEYINERDIVRVALRTAKDVDATDEEWQEFINKLEKRIVRDKA